QAPTRRTAALRRAPAGRRWPAIPPGQSGISPAPASACGYPASRAARRSAGLPCVRYCMEQMVIMPLPAGAAQRVARAEGCIGLVDEAVGQVFVPPQRDAQAGGLDDLFGAIAVIIDDQACRVELLGVPLGHLEVQRTAEQRLTVAQAPGLSQLATGGGVEPAHQLQALGTADLVDHRVAGLDEHTVPFAGGTDIQRIATAGVVHVQGAGFHEQRAPRMGQPQRGVAALLIPPVGLGFDDAGRQPQALMKMTDDLAEQAGRQLPAVALEKRTRQRVGFTVERIGSRHMSDDSRFALSSLWRCRYNACFVVAADW